MKEIRKLKGLMEELQEKMDEERERNKITNHYGVKDKDFNKIIGEIIGLLLNSDSKTDILDKLFPQLDNEGRLKVEAYYVAKEILETYRESHSHSL